MSSYALDDFAFTVEGLAEPLPSEPVRVVAAWGDWPGDREGDGLGDWSGGFVVELAGGGFAYLTGWCDYSGWGCQDGAEVTILDTLPDDVETLASGREAWEGTAVWDHDPVDLNRWIAKGMPRPYTDEWTRAGYR